ncbi:MAG: glycosyltransferase family 4 protein [Novipirellula sp. JB048]
MRVLFEGAILEILRCGGIARYFTELINRLPETTAPILLGPESPAEGFTHPRLRYEAVRTQPPLRFLRKLWHPAQHGKIARRIEQQHADLIHWTYYRGLCRRPIQRSGIPTVVTVYDFIHEAFPDTDPSGRTLAMKARAIEIADHICCISQTTYDELCERYPSAASRASITPLGSGLADVPSAPLPHELAGAPFVLFVGRRGGYKNFAVLWQAWQKIKHRTPELKLVLVGPAMKPRERTALGWSAEDARTQLYAAADDALLKTLYQHCAAFVFPSQMEGFGLPVLEAMINGAPVFASSCAALREVAGTAGYFFDPNDADTLADLLIAAGNDAIADRDSRIDQGYRRAAQFTWEQTAAKTLAVYESLLPHNLTRTAA